MSESKVTVHIDRDRAHYILVEEGWTLVEGKSSDDRPFTYYVRPGGKDRKEGGKFGDDFLWELDEALTLALEGQSHADPRFRKGGDEY